MDETTTETQLVVIPQVVAQPTEAECVAMLAEETKYKDDPEVLESAKMLLSAGYTVRMVARKLSLRETTVWSWAKSPAIQAAITAGKERRVQKVGQGLEEAAEMAIQSLLNVATDDTVNPKDRGKASEVILDRCGLVSGQSNNQETVRVAVDVDFDERLARIVAGTRG